MNRETLSEEERRRREERAKRREEEIQSHFTLGAILLTKGQDLRRLKPKVGYPEEAK